jgi:hypothetical protein
MTLQRTTAPSDQAQRPVFRALLLVQAAATTVFGLVPLLLPGLFATVTGYLGYDELVYRFAGSATSGYFVAALLALRWRPSWRELRLPLVATFTFTALAAVGCALTLADGDRHWVVFVVLAAGLAFAGLAGYWLRADEGPELERSLPLGAGWQALIAVATLAAAVFGLAGLIAPGSLAPLVGLEGTDTWVYRMSGAACFGYVPAGLLALRLADYRPIRVQNLAAVAFNATSAIVAWAAWLGGTGGLVAPVVAIAASLFAIGLAAMDWRFAGRHESEHG